MEAEVAEECDVLGAFLTLCQLGKNKETPPALALTHPDTLQTHGEVVKIALGDTASPHGALSTDMFEEKIDGGEDDAAGEDPL